MNLTPGIPPGRDDKITRSGGGGVGVNSAVGARHASSHESAKRTAFGAQFESWRARLELALAARFPDPDVVPTRLHEAMRYSVLSGGKRMRPALLFATARAAGLITGNPT